MSVLLNYETNLQAWLSMRDASALLLDNEHAIVWLAVANIQPCAVGVVVAAQERKSNDGDKSGSSNNDDDAVGQATAEDKYTCQLHYRTPCCKRQGVMTASEQLALCTLPCETDDTQTQYKRQRNNTGGKRHDTRTASARQARVLQSLLQRAHDTNCVYMRHNTHTLVTRALLLGNNYSICNSLVTRVRCAAVRACRVDVSANAPARAAPSSSCMSPLAMPHGLSACLLAQRTARVCRRLCAPPSSPPPRRPWLQFVGGSLGTRLARGLFGPKRARTLCHVVDDNNSDSDSESRSSSGDVIARHNPDGTRACAPRAHDNSHKRAPAAPPHRDSDTCRGDDAGRRGAHDTSTYAQHVVPHLWLLLHLHGYTYAPLCAQHKDTAPPQQQQHYGDSAQAAARAATSCDDASAAAATTKTAADDEEAAAAAQHATLWSLLRGCLRCRCCGAHAPVLTTTSMRARAAPHDGAHSTLHSKGAAHDAVAPTAMHVADAATRADDAHAAFTRASAGGDDADSGDSDNTTASTVESASATPSRDASGDPGASRRHTTHTVTLRLQHSSDDDDSSSSEAQQSRHHDACPWRRLFLDAVVAHSASASRPFAQRVDCDFVLRLAPTSPSVVDDSADSARGAARHGDAATTAMTSGSGGEAADAVTARGTHTVRLRLVAHEMQALMDVWRRRTRAVPDCAQQQSQQQQQRCRCQHNTTTSACCFDDKDACVARTLRAALLQLPVTRDGHDNTATAARREYDHAPLTSSSSPPPPPPRSCAASATAAACAVSLRHAALMPRVRLGSAVIAAHARGANAASASLSSTQGQRTHVAGDSAAQVLRRALHAAHTLLSTRVSALIAAVDAARARGDGTADTGSATTDDGTTAVSRNVRGAVADVRRLTRGVVVCGMHVSHDDDDTAAASAAHVATRVAASLAVDAVQRYACAWRATLLRTAAEVEHDVNDNEQQQRSPQPRTAARSTAPLTPVRTPPPLGTNATRYDVTACSHAASVYVQRVRYAHAHALQRAHAHAQQLQQPGWRVTAASACATANAQHAHTPCAQAAPQASVTAAVASSPAMLTLTHGAATSSRAPGADAMRGKADEARRVHAGTHTPAGAVLPVASAHTTATHAPPTYTARGGHGGAGVREAPGMLGTPYGWQHAPECMPWHATHAHTHTQQQQQQHSYHHHHRAQRTTHMQATGVRHGQPPAPRPSPPPSHGRAAVFDAPPPAVTSASPSSMPAALYDAYCTDAPAYRAVQPTLPYYSSHASLPLYTGASGATDGRHAIFASPYDQQALVHGVTAHSPAAPYDVQASTLIDMTPARTALLDTPAELATFCAAHEQSQQGDDAARYMRAYVTHDQPVFDVPTLTRGHDETGILGDARAADIAVCATDARAPVSSTHGTAMRQRPASQRAMRAGRRGRR